MQAGRRYGSSNLGRSNKRKKKMKRLDDSSSCCIVMNFQRLLRFLGSFLVYGYLISCVCNCSFLLLGLVHGKNLDSTSVTCTHDDSSSSNYSNSSLTFKLEITHRFSDKARKEFEERYGSDVSAAQSWPILGSAEYHNMLWNRDWRRHRGRLLMSPKHSLLTYSGGNLTEEWSDGLQYAVVNIGTPSKAYFVALDTGSDLLWVPCASCVSCGPTGAAVFSPIYNQSLTVYNPSLSSTYQTVTCKNPLCTSSVAQCSGGASSDQEYCRYEIQYLSPNTSTSGILVHDVMQFMPENSSSSSGSPPKTTASITFGCGTNQTGGFVQGSSASDGLLGLGLADISVPSTMARQGIAQNSFSMCFALDGSGRIVFGDRGPPKQPSTPLLKITNLNTYIVSLQQIIVGGTIVVPANIQAIFDTGTSFTYLSTPVYAQFAQAYDLQAPSRSFSIDIFELCYTVVDPAVLPSIALQFSNKATLNVAFPFINVLSASTNQIVGSCLTILDSGTSTPVSNIIGHNSMTNHSITFDRIAMKIGWQQTSCYKYQTSSGWWLKGQVNWLTIILATILLCLGPNLELSMIWIAETYRVPL